MFVLTAKLSKPKLIAFGVILAAVLLLIIVLAAAGGHSDPGAAAPAGETNDQRVAWLATFGWSVNAEPTQPARPLPCSPAPVAGKAGQLRGKQ